MGTPFPGMDPYLEHPALWHDVHARLVPSIGDELSSRLAPHYYVAVETRAYLMRPEREPLVTIPDVSVAPRTPGVAPGRLPLAEVDVLEVDVPMLEEVEERYLEIRAVGTHRIVTVLEVLSPTNKTPGQGREEYERKRTEVLNAYVSLVEIDLLRGGMPMPVLGNPVASPYRILIARGHRRPSAQLYAFGLRQPIPAFPVPLARGEDEPVVDLNGILHALYERAHFELRLDYAQPPIPPLNDADTEWARDLIAKSTRS